MQLKHAFGALLLIGVPALLSQQAGNGSAILVNSGEAKWTHDAGDPPGSESVMLREDPSNGSMELLVRYPAGHVFAPHWHSVNERMILIEGRMSVNQGSETRYLESGGFAYLPAKQVQKMACVSKTRCSFYVYWDGKLDFHSAAEAGN